MCTLRILTLVVQARLRESEKNAATLKPHTCSVTCMDRYGQWGSVVFSTVTLYVDSLRGVWRLDQHLAFLVAFLKPFLSIGVLQYVSCCRECHRYRIAWPVIMFTAYAKVTSTWLPRDKVSQQNIEHFNKIISVIHNRTSFTGCCGSLLCSSVLQKSPICSSLQWCCFTFLLFCVYF